ncbi:MAG: GAF domain-containing protein [Armatimonadetes bacterium]|nr:GAF domain-containing protein [Armatimonadota bacterium]
MTAIEPDYWKSQYDRLKNEFDALQNRLQRVQQENQDLKAKTGEDVATQPVTSPTEFEETLKRLVVRVAMILQSEKCMFLLLDRDTGELVGTPPAFGFEDGHLKSIRIKATEGVSGLVFRTGQPHIVEDSSADPRVVKDFVDATEMRNDLCVPLIIEKRDEDNRIVDRQTIGVLHVLNKRYGGAFGPEDIKLLTVLSRNAAAVIAQAQLFFEVEERVREVEATIESSPFGVLMVNTHNGITQMNASARKMLQAKPDVVGGDYRQCIQNEVVVDAIAAALESGEEKTEELTVGLEDAAHYYQMQTAIVRGEEGEPIGVLAAFNDVTEIRTIEQMKTSLVSHVSHELRTPMTAIQGFIQTLLEDENEEWYDRDTRREFYQIINQEALRLRKMVSTMLNVSRIEAGRILETDFQMHDLPKHIGKIIAFQQPYATNHTLIVDAEDELPQIEYDEDMIDQVLTNLVSNAIKYSPNGGEVRIKVAHDDLDRQVRVEVTDQGLGIPPDAMPKLFQKYTRVDSPGHKGIAGTGVGLFLVKSLIENYHHGKIWVESEYGHGSNFIFTLPYRQPEKPMDETEEA